MFWWFLKRKEIDLSEKFEKVFPEINWYKKVFDWKNFWLFNKENKKVLPCKYQNLFSVSEGYLIFWSFYSEEIRDTDWELIEIKKWEKRWVINLKWSVIIEPWIYKDIFYVRNWILQWVRWETKVFINIKTLVEYWEREDCFMSIEDNIEKIKKEKERKNNEILKKINVEEPKKVSSYDISNFSIIKNK